MIKDVIIATIQGEEHLGDNLKKQCIDYLEQYCERTDCSGRIGNSKKVEELIKENEKLKESLHQASIGIQELIEQDIECPTTCEKLKQENEKLNHYKLLYQKVKDRNDKAIDFLENHRSGSDWYDTRDLLDILKGNNEEVINGE